LKATWLITEDTGIMLPSFSRTHWILDVCECAENLWQPKSLSSTHYHFHTNPKQLYSICPEYISKYIWEGGTDIPFVR